MNKILMISHNNCGGGAETVFLEVVKVLELKKELTIVLPSKNGFLTQKLKDKKIEILSTHNYLFNSSIIKLIISFFCFNLFSIIKLINYINDKKIECIYSSTILNYTGSILSIITKRKHIWHIHEMNNLGYEWFDPKFNFIFRYLFKKSKIIFLSEECKNSWLKRLKIKDSELDYEVIYNPIKKLNKKILVERNNIVIGCAGTFNQNKNQKLLIETFIKLSKNYSNIFLKMAGEEVVENSEKIINGRLKKEKYQLYDYIDIEKFFNQIDILIVPSFSESWSLVAIEAACMGLIVVITKNTSINEIMRDNENLFFIDPFSKEDLYKKLDYIILNYKEVDEKIKCNNEKFFKKNDLNKQFEEKIEIIFQ